MSATYPVSWIVFRCFFVAMASACLSACSVSSDLSAAEKSVLFTEADFSGYDVAVDTQPTGEFEKIVDYLNRSTELGYETPSDMSTVYVMSSVTIERSAVDALGTELANKAGVLIGFKAAGIEESPVEFAKPYGDRSTLVVLKKDGAAIGNRFSAVIDNKVVIVVFSGIYFDTEASFRQLFDAKMKRIEEYSARK